MYQTAPKFQANFLAGALDPRVGFSRADNNATRINASGAIEVVNADLPRFDYDPVTLQPRGLLIEDGKENLLRNSGWLNAVSGTPGTAPTDWSFFSNSGSTVVTSGDLGGNKIEFVANQRIYIIRYYGIAAFSTTTLSVYLDAISGNVAINNILTWFSAPSGSTQTYFVDGVARPASYVPSAGSRLSLKIVAGATGTGVSGVRLGIGVNYNAVVNDSVTLSKPQVEVDGMTSYVPTPVGATATRGADIATITGTKFSSFWRANKGSALVRATPSSVSWVGPVLQFDDATADNIIALRGNTTNPELYIRAGGADQAQIDAGTIAANTGYRLAGAWATDDCAASLNSGAPVLDGVATIPTVTQARLGSDGTNYLNGHIEAIGYYDERLPSASLQVLSSQAGRNSIIGSVFRDSIIS